MLLPHTKTALGLIPELCRSFFVPFACSPHAWVDFLWVLQFSSSTQKHAQQANSSSWVVLTKHIISQDLETGLQVLHRSCPLFLTGCPGALKKWSNAEDKFLFRDTKYTLTLKRDCCKFKCKIISNIHEARENPECPDDFKGTWQTASKKI